MGNDKQQTDDADQPNQQLRGTAYHEAGHAVMAISLGRPIEKVTISPAQLAAGGASLGACKIQKGRNKRSKDQVEDSVLILLAGMVAESRVTGRYCQQGAARDLMMVKELLTAGRAKNEKQFQKLAKRMVDKTEHVLGEPGPHMAVKLIAEELLKKETISGRAVRHLFEVANKKTA